MEFPNKPLLDDQQVIIRVEALIQRLKRLHWFGFSKTETTAFIYYWVYHRYLKMGAVGIFKHLLASGPKRNPGPAMDHGIDFEVFLELCFARFLTPVQRSTISDIQVQSGLAEMLTSLESIGSHHSDQEFAADFEYFLRTAVGRDTHDTQLHAHLAYLLLHLFDLPSNARIANPFAGKGALVPFLPSGIDFHLDSPDPQDHAVLAIRLLVHGLFDSLLEPPRLSSTSHVEADWVISYPAFDREFVALPRKPMDSPADVSQKLIRNLLLQCKDKGKVFLVTPHRNLVENTRGAVALQKALGTSGFLDYVITLPGDLVDLSGMNISIVVLDKARPRNAPVRLMEAATWQQDFKSPEKLDLGLTIRRFKGETPSEAVFLVRREKLAQWQYKPSISRAKLERRIDQETAQLQQGESLVPLNSLLQKPKADTATPTGLHKVGIPQLQALLSGNRLGLDDLAKLPLLVASDKGYQAVSLARPLIVVPKYISGARPTIIDAPGARVAIHESLLAFHVDARAVDIDFLVLVMNSGFFLDQLREVNSHSIQPALTIPEFLALKVRLPASITQQKRRLEEFYEVSHAVRIKETSLQQKVEGLEQTEHQMLAVMGHELRPLLANVRTLSALTKLYLQNQSASGSNFSMDHRLSPRPKSPTLERAFEYIDADLNRMGMLFDSLRGLMASERAKMTLTEVDFLKCIQSFTLQLADQLRNADFYFAADPILAVEKIRPLVTIDQELLMLALRNIVENAFEHGFEEGNAGNSIVFYLSCNADEDGSSWAAIDCLNNGKPFPPDFTLEKYTQFGGRQGKSKGTGIGGFLVNRIVQNHEGHLRMMSGKDISLAIHQVAASLDIGAPPLQAVDRPFLVGIRILLPYHHLENDQPD